MAAGNTQIKTQNISIGYHTPLLNRLNLELHRGQLIALMGKNGTGKSTLLRSLIGMEPVLEGTVILNGKALETCSAPAIARQISYCGANMQMPGSLRVRELVLYGRYPYLGFMARPRQKDFDRVEHAMTAMHIKSLSERFLNELSDGERQRALIARSLAQDTPFILLDEPAAHLDLVHKSELMLQLRSLCEKMDKGIIYASHDMDALLHYPDTLWMIHDGTIVCGDPADLVLLGQVENMLCSGNSLKMDTAGGKLIRPEYESREICLKAQGAAFDWTKSALQRISFRVSCNKSASLCVIVENAANGYEWTLRKGADQQVFKSIETLIHHLKHTDYE